MFSPRTFPARRSRAAAQHVLQAGTVLLTRLPTGRDFRKAVVPCHLLLPALPGGAFLAAGKAMKRLLLALTICLTALPAAWAREPMVMAVSGKVMLGSGKAARPLELYAEIAPGSRIHLEGGSLASIFFAADALIVDLGGPGQYVVRADKVEPASPKSPSQIKVRPANPAYKDMKVNGKNLAQASLVMRSAAPIVALAAPEGLVSEAEARRFRWAVDGDRALRLVVATDGGDLVHRADVKTSEFILPDTVALKPGVKYVWSISTPAGEANPLDWTEFMVTTDDRELAARPGEGASPADHALYAAWLAERDLKRAAVREVRRGSAVQ